MEIQEVVADLSTQVFPTIENELLRYYYCMLFLQQEELSFICNGGVDRIIEESKKYGRDGDQARFIKITLHKIYSINNLGYGVVVSNAYVFTNNINMQKNLDSKHGKNMDQSKKSAVNIRTQLMSGGKIPVEKMISHRVPFTLDNIPQFISSIGITHLGDVFGINNYYTLYQDKRLTPFKKNYLRTMNSRMYGSSSSFVGSILSGDIPKIEEDMFLKNMTFVE